MITHQIPSHLAFCTPRQNQKAKQGTNSETLKRNKQTQKQLHISHHARKIYPLHLLLTVKCLVMVGWASSVLTNSKDHQALRDFQCL